MNFSEFWSAFADSGSTWEKFPFDLPVSDKARKIFSPMRGNLTQKMIASTKIFQEVGYAAANAPSAGCFGEEYYGQFQARARETSVRFYPVDFTTFFAVEQTAPNYYGLLYVSNVLD